MARMTVITKSYAPDFELCADLQRSVLRYTPSDVEHHIIVPRTDLKLFGQLAGPRTRVICMADYLPKSFYPLPLIDFTLNLKRPFPPVRGWILQQIVKLAAAAASSDDVVLVTDSDVVFVREFGPETFFKDGLVRFYRARDEVDERLPRHMIWHRDGRKLLGVPQSNHPYHDYVTGMVACDPGLVRRMLAHVETCTGLPWATAIGAELHFSEWTLYGIYVDEVVGPAANAFASDDPLCHGHWGRPLDRNGIVQYLDCLKSTDVAAMISSKSNTPLDLKRAVFEQHFGDMKKQDAPSTPAAPESPSPRAAHC